MRADTSAGDITVHIICYLMLAKICFAHGTFNWAMPQKYIVMVYKSTRDHEPLVHLTIALPTTSASMDSHSNAAKRMSIRKDKIASLTYIQSTHTNLSEPEDSMLSGVESFDEDDMYPVDYDDEPVSDSSEPDGESESPSGRVVCPSCHT